MSTPDINFAKVRFQCRRGMSELENILYPFCDQRFNDLTVAEQQDFVTLLAAEDTELWDWLVTRQAQPPKSLQHIVRLIHDAT